MGVPYLGRLERPTWGDGLRRPRRRLKKNWAPKFFLNFTRAMSIPNMCLVLKLDNGHHLKGFQTKAG